MNVQYITTDTGEAVNAPTLPSHWGVGEWQTEDDGYEWFRCLEGTPWTLVTRWGSEGHSLGKLYSMMVATAVHEDERGTLYGYGSYCQGYSHTLWFRSEAALHAEITDTAFFYWKDGQSQGPDTLPATARELPAEYTVPYQAPAPVKDTLRADGAPF
ncbi:hypothetical protein [uncultured Arthrobacter sp.]|uniref:hypothetical protein n=1 Tax=uncultured Arthrobacter sp. TaxID=114050 RepID=UPI00261D71D5|nr:hypothetical protein [uncultured Arthrobacter sp.]